MGSGRQVWVAPLKKGGNLLSDPDDKAEILNDQFRSVFTPRVSEESVPKLGGTPYPSIRPMTINVAGVEKLLSKLNVKKAS